MISIRLEGKNRLQREFVAKDKKSRFSDFSFFSQLVEQQKKGNEEFVGLLVNSLWMHRSWKIIKLWSYRSNLVELLFGH